MDEVSLTAMNILVPPLFDNTPPPSETDTMSKEEEYNALPSRSSAAKLKDRVKSFYQMVKRPTDPRFIEKAAYQIMGTDSIFFINRLGPHPLSQVVVAYGVIFSPNGTEVPSMMSLSELGTRIHLT